MQLSGTEAFTKLSDLGGSDSQISRIRPNPARIVYTCMSRWLPKILFRVGHQRILVPLPPLSNVVLCVAQLMASQAPFARIYRRQNVREGFP